MTKTEYERWTNAMAGAAYALESLLLARKNSPRSKESIEDAIAFAKEKFTIFLGASPGGHTALAVAMCDFLRELIGADVAAESAYFDSFSGADGAIHSASSEAPFTTI